MKNIGLICICSMSFLGLYSSTSADSSNGYTTAANVYTGSSSRSWFGGGVDYVLAEWRKEDKLSKEKGLSSSSLDTSKNSVEPIPIAQ